MAEIYELTPESIKQALIESELLYEDNGKFFVAIKEIYDCNEEVDKFVEMILKLGG